MNEEPTVFLVDDDASLRDGLRYLIESIDLRVETYESAAKFLDDFEPDRSGCLVVDVRMPGISGLELQDQLVARKIGLPIIVITGHGDVPMCVRAFQGGAFAFLEKPVNHQLLLDCIHRAIEKDRLTRRERRVPHDRHTRLHLLTAREQEVMEHIAAGLSMKQIAAELNISIQTCSKHRARVLEKLEVENDVELVRLLLSADRKD
jgi:two-component system response regulator FixJ